MLQNFFVGSEPQDLISIDNDPGYMMRVFKICGLYFNILYRPAVATESVKKLIGK